MGAPPRGEAFSKGERHPAPVGSADELPQCVESDRCDGDMTLYILGCFVAGLHFVVGGIIASCMQSDLGFGELHGSCSAYTTDVIGRL